MASGFYGMFTPRLDDKGRITIPVRYRKRFSDGAMVVRGVTQCLYLFTADEFEDFAEEAVNTPVTDTARLGPARYLMANSDFQTLDAQGRITLNTRMRDWAELGRDVVLTGQGKRMEIWNTDRWESYEAAQEAAYVDPSLRAAPSAAPSAAPTSAATAGGVPGGAPVPDGPDGYDDVPGAGPAAGSTTPPRSEP